MYIYRAFVPVYNRIFSLKLNPQLFLKITNISHTKTLHEFTDHIQIHLSD